MSAPNSLTPAERDVLVEKHFPGKLARCTKSKQRTNLRKQAEIAEKLIALRATGAECSNCKHLWGPSGGPPRLYCSMHSDFYGTLHPELNYLCVEHDFALQPKEDAV